MRQKFSSSLAVVLELETAETNVKSVTANFV